MIRVDEGPMFVIFRSVPSGCRNDAIGSSSARIADARVWLAHDAAGRFVSLAGAEAHARFKQYRHDVHSGAASMRAVVEREQLRPALDSLVLVAHWVTPPIDTRQFDTRFFLARV